MNFKDIEKKVKNFADNKGMTYWGNALAGEVGETCNIIKKLDRDGMLAVNDQGDQYIDLLPEEIADVFIYTVLLARYFKIDLEKAIMEKIGVVYRRHDDVLKI